MGSLKWNALAGLWNDPANWTILSGPDSVPAAGDDVTIDAPLNYVVTVTGAQAAHNVLLNAAGARLDIAGTLALAGTLTDQAGTLQLPSGGVLRGGLVRVTSGATSFTGGTLDSVTWLGPLTLANGTLAVANQLTLRNADASPHGTLDLRDLGTIEFTNSQTFDDAVITVPTLTGEGAIIAVQAGTTLTIGPSVQMAGTMSGGAAITFSGGGTVINQGSLAISALGPVFGFHGLLNSEDPFINAGIIDLRGLGMMRADQGLTNNGGIFNAGGGMAVFGDLTGTGTITLAASLGVSGTISAGQHMSAYGHIFTLSAAAIESGATLDGFGSTGKIDLTGVTFSGNVNAFWSGTPSGGTLTIKDGATTKAELFLTGISNSATFSVAADKASGTAITTDNIPCFRAGTAIRTPRGDVAIEALRPGDLVVTLKSGRPQPIRWIGHRHVVATRHRAPQSVWPIRIRRGAIAPGVPGRDLFVSPEHALFLHGVLVPARHLVNGHTIAQVAQPEVTYYHLELPVHDLVLAEAQPSETFLDMGNRGDFDNAGAPLALHPGFGAGITPDDYWRANACAPQLRGGPAVDAIRHAINTRAARLLDGSLAA